MAIQKTINCQPWQYGFMTSEARYPAIVSGWATGKTLCGILQAVNLSLESPDNLGLICRKEYTDLKDSTMKDFERYTGLIIGSGKNVKLPNGSVIMFRHAEELDVLKNINLGFFLMEQAEEFDTDDQFMYLRGRLRRDGVKNHRGLIIANTNGHNWIYRLWKQTKGVDPLTYELFEATTFDNREHLPEGFIKDLDDIKAKTPAIYNRFVMNSWETDDADASLIKASWVEAAMNPDRLNRRVYEGPTKRIIGVDYAREGNDRTVCYYMRNYEQLSREQFPLQDGVLTANQIVKFRETNHATSIGLDTCGMGAIVGDILGSLGQDVIRIDSASKSSQPEKFVNLRAEMWVTAAAKFQENWLTIENDPILLEELTTVKYFVKGGRIQIEEKADVKERIGRSPDRADALIYSIYTVDQARACEVSIQGIGSGIRQPEQINKFIHAGSARGGW